MGTLKRIGSSLLQTHVALHRSTDPMDHTGDLSGGSASFVLTDLCCPLSSFTIASLVRWLRRPLPDLGFDSRFSMGGFPGRLVAGDPGFDSPLLRGDFFSGSSHTNDLKKLALQSLPCQALGVVGSALGLAGPVSVYCD